jgi:hypothetical protein
VVPGKPKTTVRTAVQARFLHHSAVVLSHAFSIH